MEDSDILRHLLDIEARAAALVDEAQAEADRRIRAGEEENRLFYEEQYQNLAEELDADYRAAMEAARAEYRRSLDEYRAGLDALALDHGAFEALAFSLLLGPSGAPGIDGPGLAGPGTMPGAGLQ